MFIIKVKGNKICVERNLRENKYTICERTNQWEREQRKPALFREQASYVCLE